MNATDSGLRSAKHSRSTRVTRSGCSAPLGAICSTRSSPASFNRTTVSNIAPSANNPFASRGEIHAEVRFTLSGSSSYTDFHVGSSVITGFNGYTPSIVISFLFKPIVQGNQTVNEERIHLLPSLSSDPLQQILLQNVRLCELFEFERVVGQTLQAELQRDQRPGFFSYYYFLRQHLSV